MTKTVAQKYWEIINHKAFVVDFQDAIIDVIPVDVNPSTDRIEDDTSLNTKHQCWVELSIPLKEKEDFCTYDHVWELDTGGDSFEEAISNLYDLVIEKYGESI